MELVFRGKAWKFGDDINTDDIAPGKWHFAYIEDFKAHAKDLGKHVAEYIYPNFAKSVKPGDIIVAGNNFACGSSRESAPWALIGTGISCVVAESFARIFYRNAINTGLPILACKGISEIVRAGDELEVNFDTGKIKNLTTGAEIITTPLSGVARDIIMDGGLIEHTRKKLGINS